MLHLRKAINRKLSELRELFIGCMRNLLYSQVKRLSKSAYLSRTARITCRAVTLGIRNDWHLQSHLYGVCRRYLDRILASFSFHHPVLMSLRITLIRHHRSQNRDQWNPSRKWERYRTGRWSTYRETRWAYMRLHIFLLHITLMRETMMFFRSDPKEPSA